MRQQKSFVLKLWNDSCDEEMWRASLEDLHSKHKEHFASLGDLFKAIQEGLELADKSTDLKTGKR